ncbi:MAG TPA: PDZ domain-containing protein [Terriglobales bacterium]|nr:PDZ domain-containing protein [Terriglobales bacterium]
MITKRQVVAVAVLLTPFLLPTGSNAQPENRPYVYFGEDSGSTSYLGVDTRDVTQDQVADLHLKEETGVEITMVDQDAPAGKAGLKEHDVILSINDQKIESEEQLRRVIHEIPPGRTVTIGISRNGQPMTLKAQLAEKDMDHGMGMDVHVPPINIPAIHIPPINMPEIDVPSVVVIHSPRSSGIMVENLTPQLGEFFGVKSGSGVLIRSVEKGSHAEQAGFRAGDVIVKVNGSSVNDCSDFTRLLRERRETKAAVTVIRDHKEQNLTLTLPEPRRSGLLENCGHIEGVTCAQIVDEGTKVAKLIPEINTGELKRLQPEMECLKKRLAEDAEKNRGQVQKELENMQQELSHEKEEMDRQMKEWIKDSEI